MSGTEHLISRRSFTLVFFDAKGQNLLFEQPRSIVKFELCYGEKIFHGTEKIVRNMELFEIWRFELGEVNYESLLRNFHRATEFVRIMEVFELGEVEL